MVHAYTNMYNLILAITASDVDPKENGPDPKNASNMRDSEVLVDQL
jgi:hypothetical protein